MGDSVLGVDAHDGRKPMTCFIRDISELGARLMLTQDAILPDEVTILVGNVTHRARVAWRKGDQIGVEFLEIEEIVSSDPLTNSD